MISYLSIITIIPQKMLLFLISNCMVLILLNISLILQQLLVAFLLLAELVELIPSMIKTNVPPKIKPIPIPNKVGKPAGEFIILSPPKTKHNVETRMNKIYRMLIIFRAPFTNIVRLIFSIDSANSP